MRRIVPCAVAPRSFPVLACAATTHNATQQKHGRDTLSTHSRHTKNTEKHNPRHNNFGPVQVAQVLTPEQQTTAKRRENRRKKHNKSFRITSTGNPNFPFGENRLVAGIARDYFRSVLTKIADRGETLNAAIAIIAAKYNATYTDALVRSAQEELTAAGIARIEVIRVPGSFEIPVVASRLAQANDPVFEAIICFGAIFQGQTSHAQNIADSVSHSLAGLQIHSGKPIIHGVLLFQDEVQARVRCFGKDHNRGVEAARTALEMVRVMRALQNFERELLD